MSKEIDIPHSVQAEAAVLGCCMLENGCIDDAAAALTRDDFWELRHQNLFDLIVKLRNEGSIVDAITILQESKDTVAGGINSLGGIAYVSSLPDQIPSAAGLPAYVATVTKKSKLRSLVHTAQQILSITGQKGDDEDLLDEAQGKLMALLSMDREGGLIPLKDVVKQAIGDIEDAFANQGKLMGIPTGFASLDGLTTGFKNGDMIVLAARPSQGKTSLAMTIAENAAIENEISTGILSLEMTSRALVKRMIGSRAGVDGHHLMNGRLSAHEITRLTTEAAKISKAPLHIDQTGNLSVTQMMSKARHLKYKHSIKFLIIDYLQLMHAKADSRVQEVTKISAAVKAVAKELDIPVLVLSQLSRRVEEQDRSPRLSDLRDSGSIEQDADVVALLHKTNEDNIVEVLVAKHRNGPCGTAKLEFVPHLTRFKVPVYE
jgi:replicative DNA helicase